MNGWNVRHRLMAGFFALVALLLIIAGLAYYEIGHLASLAAISRDTDEGNVFMLERNIDHLTWVHALDAYIAGSSQEFTGQLDSHKCRLGEWLYNREVRDRIEDSEVRALLDRIEAPHTQLHESARAIIAARAPKVPVM